MKKGIPCFDYSEIGPKRCYQIDFHFVAGDEEISSSCRVSLGDTDPMTGENLTDVTFFQDYHAHRNREIYYNKKAIAVPLTSREKELREQERERIATEFEREHGYAPPKDTLEWLLNEKWPKRYRKEIDSFVNEEGESWADCMPEFADPTAECAFRAVEEEGHTLDDFELKLTEIQRDVFRLLRLKSEGINVHGMGNQLAEKWGVDKSDISHAKKQIGKKLLKWLNE